MNKNEDARYLPERLNREPTVIRGLTNNELLLVIGSGVVVGLVLGVLIVVLLLPGQLPAIPTSMALCGYLALRFGSDRLAAAKRNKPGAWFYRMLEWRLHHGSVSRLFFRKASLIDQDATWWLRRERVQRRLRRKRQDRLD
ncbi:hypothetical protein WH50_15290 [Pokkaliibacter plantistimulans]|uniref:Conjugal transfer protein n=1 Tax=Pokkaliibacter plantistimulans TaxID=1635171 RepID=A0ABX5LUS5_9GAMM|nr:TIGR03750 family conjugal transfer protein [Pokkaliibacter plantistimulans]PXF30431.1 hypothetical protein WH50_15290 [Pokkaliibacter plantistimulans]